MTRRRTLPRIAASFVLGAALCLAAGPASAQGHLGVFGGLNIANMGGDMDRIGDDLALELDNQLGGSWTADKTTRTGAVVGVSYYSPISPTLGLQIEGQYASRGTKFDLSDRSSGFSAETKFKLNYLEFPLLLRISPPMSGRTGLFIVAGPVIGFKTTADAEVSAQGQSQSTDIGEGFKSTTFGALAGIGLKVASGPATNLTIQARYYLGLSNALDDNVYDSKSQDFTILAGLEFGLGL